MNHFNVLVTGWTFVFITQFSNAVTMRLRNSSSYLQFFEPSARYTYVDQENTVPRYLLELYRQRHYPSRRNDKNTTTAFFLEGGLVKLQTNYRSCIRDIRVDRAFFSFYNHFQRLLLSLRNTACII